MDPIPAMRAAAGMAADGSFPKAAIPSKWRDHIEFSTSQNSS